MDAGETRDRRCEQWCEGNLCVFIMAHIDVKAHTLPSLRLMGCMGATEGSNKKELINRSTS